MAQEDVAHEKGSGGWMTKPQAVTDALDGDVMNLQDRFDTKVRQDRSVRRFAPHADDSLATTPHQPAGYRHLQGRSPQENATLVIVLTVGRRIISFLGTSKNEPIASLGDSEPQS